MKFKTNKDNIFSVPCVVVDNLLQMASGDYIKVLLYVLRRSGKEFTENEVSYETGISPEEVDKAIDFWKRTKILLPDITENDDILPVPKTTSETDAPENPPEKKLKKYKKSHLSGADIAEIKTEDPEISELFEVVEDSIGLVNNTQANLIIYMHNDLGLKAEVIIILINYCKDIGKAHANYIERIAYKWSEDNINTLEMAQKEVEKLIENQKYSKKVMNILKVSDLSNDHTAMVEKWSDWGIPLELVAEAYDMCLKSKQTEYKFNFDYANGIINNWHEKGINDLKGVYEENKTYKKKNAGKRKTYNNDKYKTFDDEDFDVEMYNIFMNDFEVI